MFCTKAKVAKGGVYLWDTVIHSFFPSSKISSKKYLCKIIFGQTKLDENNLQVMCGGH